MAERPLLTPDQHAAELAHTLRLALEIAADAARADVECECFSVQLEGYTWWSTADHGDRRINLGPQELALLTRSVDYLQRSGAIARHAQRPHLVRFLK